MVEKRLVEGQVPKRDSAARPAPESKGSGKVLEYPKGDDLPPGELADRAAEGLDESRPIVPEPGRFAPREEPLSFGTGPEKSVADIKPPVPDNIPPGTSLDQLRKRVMSDMSGHKGSSSQRSEKAGSQHQENKAA